MSDVAFPPPPPPSPLVTGKAYDILKFVALVLLPAASTLYYSLSLIWGLPNVEQVLGTMVAIDTFLGVFLKISKDRYIANPDRHDGEIIVVEDEDGAKTYSLVLNVDPYELDSKSEVSFQVKSQ